MNKPAPIDTGSTALLPDAADALIQALQVLDDLLATAREIQRNALAPTGRPDPALLESGQDAAHGLAWLATYVESLRQLSAWAERLERKDCFGEMEQLILQIGAGEYLAQIRGGIMMSQHEFCRPETLSLNLQDAGFEHPAITHLLANGNNAAARARLVELMTQRQGSTSYGALGLDEEFDIIRDQFKRFSDEKIQPHAHKWHLDDQLIPMEILTEMAELGVFGLTIPEEHGGFGMGKTAMCVVSEELSRGYIGVGSLGTRSEIAAELILGGGTNAQKAKYLPAIAAGEILPTAVFTEPDTGSDLGSLRTRAQKQADGSYKITGNKTWITHAARADIMTLLARTDPDSADHRGLSMFIAEKPRGTEEEDFPATGMSGGEIEVLGYRGMKEYELGFDGFEVSQDGLLGGEEGQGFRQLMRTFESARIQTAARAIGVAQAALDQALSYATERRQFGKTLAHFPRVQNKLAMMAVEIMIARQLTYHSAREKDSDRRCDLEAGMAKLLGARVAWAAADNCLQIHGGNGFALEYTASRILCDARILNIFEGAAEIQAQVIARRLLES